MVYVKKGGFSLKQMAYARRVFNGDGESKAQVARDLGYSPNVARSISSHIEHTDGFHNAMTKLAYESNNMALAAIEQFKIRGFDGFTNAEMIKALTAISTAWAKFNTDKPDKASGNKTNTNKLRTVILQQVENQTMLSGDAKAPITQKEEPKPEPIQELDLDF